MIIKLRFIICLLMAIISVTSSSCKSTEPESPTTTDKAVKTFSILGDSYSTFEGYVYPDNAALWYTKEPINDTDVYDATQTWWWKFRERNGLEIVRNCSWSGSTVCTTGYEGYDYTHCAFVTRMYDVGNPDLLIIFGGTNDYWSGAPIGQWIDENWDADDLRCFKPAALCLLNYLTKTLPYTRIVWVVNTDFSEEFDKIIRDICKHYNVECIELQPIEKRNGHPTINGMIQISEQLTTKLKLK